MTPVHTKYYLCHFIDNCATLKARIRCLTKQGLLHLEESEPLPNMGINSVLDHTKGEDKAISAPNGLDMLVAPLIVISR